MERPPQQPGRKIPEFGHSPDKVKSGLAEDKNMNAGLALQPDLNSRLQSFADGSSSVVSDSSFGLLREAGLTDREIGFLAGDDTSCLRLVAGLLAHSLRVYGPSQSNDWLHQPIRRFDSKSPLEFVAATKDFDKVHEYLIQVSEGYFF